MLYIVSFAFTTACSLPGGVTSFRVVGGILLASVHCSPKSVQDEVPSGVTTGTASADKLPRGKWVSVLRVSLIVLQFLCPQEKSLRVSCVHCCNSASNSCALLW